MAIPHRCSNTTFLKGESQISRTPTLGVPSIRFYKAPVALQVRPYTTRKGDTIESIATKRGFTADDLLKLNHNLNIKDKVEEGKRILLPADALSERDKEIIAGIGGRYRTYPVRKGETVEDIISARGITMEELELLNPELNVKKGVKPNTVLKLPSGKYTVREREMLTGVGHVPPEFFQSKGFIGSVVVVGIAVVVSLYFWFRGSTKKDD